MREDLIAAREEHANRFRHARIPLYPTWSGRSHTAAEVRAQADDLSAKETEVTVAGRLRAKRAHGGASFFDVHDASGKIQVWLRADRIGAEATRLADALDLGDIVRATGAVTKTKAGEITVDAASWSLLAKSRLPLPDDWAGLRNVERRARQRELDLLVNADARAAFLLRSRLVRALRAFLAERGFLEVETPVLQPIPGGATARPFATRHNALALDLFLRVSPELYLKRLVIGGLERVFEIARNFRNEGVDRQHNPEFTMCECYMAYATVEDLLPFSEELLSFLFSSLGRTATVAYRGETLDFTPPWRRVSFPERIREATGIDLLARPDEETLLTQMKQRGIEPPAVPTLPALVDTLFQAVIRKNATQPTIVRDHPALLDPLAKRRDDAPELSQRFQLVAAGMELINAYTELNDPDEQEARFREQEAYRRRGDTEAQRLDRPYLRALRIGLPPTAGWGLGVDRLAMLLTNSAHIRDVIPFPLLRPEESNDA